jgi:hypothetical protein
MILSRSWITVLAVIILSPTPLFAQDWPQWRGPNRDGSVATRIAEWPKTLKEEWKVTVGLGHASPVIAGNRIYVFARQGEDETLLCLDAATGKEIWKTSEPISYTMHPAAVGHGKGPKSTPVVSGGNVFTLGISGVLAAHDAKTGKLKWRHEFSEQYPKTSPLFGTAMSPIVDRGLLIAHVGGHDKGALTAFDVETGAVKWTNELDGPAYASPIIVTLAGVRQIVTFMQKEFGKLDHGDFLQRHDHLFAHGQGNICDPADKGGRRNRAARSLEQHGEHALSQHAGGAGQHAVWLFDVEEGPVLRAGRRYREDFVAGPGPDGRKRGATERRRLGISRTHK